MLVRIDGKYFIKPEGTLCEDEALARMKAIIRLLQVADRELIDNDTVFFALESVIDLLPNEDQYKVENK